MDFKKELAQAISNSISGQLTAQTIEGFLETPKDSKLGDTALPCFKLAPVLKKAPAEIAKELKEGVKLPQGFEKAEAIGAYLNFFLQKQGLAKQIIPEILKKKEKFGCSEKTGKKIMVEYSAPNTNKPLHLGHLRNDSIGMAVSNILEANGNKVIRANLYNDRGIHICKSMLAYKKFGKGKTPEKAKNKSDHFVGDFYVKFAKEAEKNPKLEEEAQEMLKKWEAGDKETRALWKKMNNWILKGFKETYKRFGSRFETEFFESQFYGKAKPVIELGLKKGVFEKDSAGAIIARLEPEMQDKIVMRADGTSIYISNDLVLTKHKFEKFGLDKAIWVVGNEQNFYLKQLFAIFEKLGFEWAKKCFHLAFGMVFLPEGKMKSREGKVVDADNLMDEMAVLAEKEIKKRHKGLSKKEILLRREKIALAAIKFYLLKIDVARDMNFDPKKSIAFEGETGPYLQYTYARAKSILRKAKAGEFKSIKFDLLKEPLETKLVSILSEYPKIMEKTGSNMSPHTLCHYLISLAEQFNSFYHELSVINAKDKNTAKARLALVAATSQILKNGLALLNIEVLEKM
ncbi:MAG: arginine--tRNA ligase [Candidatus Diapherotrites archaeon]|nr:arginine--tRNA ligase [Candidatus Diapherotrites archaeon]